MQKLEVTKELSRKDYIKEYFINLNKYTLKSKLTDKETEILIYLYNIKGKFVNLISKEVRDEIAKELNISKPNISTYLKKFKEMKILVKNKDIYTLHSNISIKSKEIHFTTKLILKDE